MSDTEVVPVETPVIPPVEVVEPPPEPTPEPIPPKPQMVPVAVVAGLRGKARELENELAQARRETQEARALAERLTAQQKPEDKEPPRYIPPVPTDEAEIERKAEYLVFKREVGQVQQRGMEKYGSSFNDTIRALAAVGADNDAFVSQVLAVDSSKAHELLNSLAQDLEKTATLVSMDPNRRIVELTRMATATPKVETKVAEEPKVPPKVVSKAPPPAPIVEPTTHKEIDWRSDEASDEEFDKGYWENMKKRNARR